MSRDIFTRGFTTLTTILMSKRFQTTDSSIASMSKMKRAKVKGRKLEMAKRRQRQVRRRRRGRKRRRSRLQSVR